MRFRIYSTVWLVFIAVFWWWTYLSPCTDGLFIGACGFGKLIVRIIVVLHAVGYGIGVLVTRGMGKQLLRLFLCLVISVGFIVMLGGMLGILLGVVGLVMRLFSIK